MGLNFISSVGIKGEMIGVDSRWLRSPSMASLDMPFLSLSKCPSKGLDLRSFLRDPFLRRFKLYALKGLYEAGSLRSSQNHHWKGFPRVEFLLPLVDFEVQLGWDG
jgi:hypothetical protein